MALRSTSSKRKGGTVASSNQNRPSSEKQDDGGVKLEQSAERASNEGPQRTTRKKRSISKKRILDAKDSNAFKSGTKDSLSDRPAKTKKVNRSDGSIRKPSSSQANTKSQPQKPPHASSRPEDTADTRNQKSESEDSRTAMLLKGFESSDEEDAPGKNLGTESLEPVEEVPAIPVLQQTADGAESKGSHKQNNAGVVYVGRIPHGFYEHQMNAYFSQFGEIRRLRISRNRKTGHVKHYGFIEFASSEVASIVAATMDKYLLFGHILQVRVIPSDQVHPELFKGAGKKFRVIPRNKTEAKMLKAGLSREGWQKRIKAEESRRKKKITRVRRMMDYSYEAPTITKVTEIPLRIAEGKKDSNEETVSAQGVGDLLSKNDNGTTQATAA